jgi:hypothetical protein
MTFSFTVATSDTYTTTYGVEYTFALNGYEWTSDSAYLVLVFEFKSCGDDFSSSDFDGEDSETNTRRRRRRMARIARGRRALLEDTEDDTETDTEADTEGDAENGEESDDGISEDDSNELDIGIASFVNHGSANCVNDTTVIPTHLVYGGKLDSDEMHMVFEHFACSDIEQDPWMGLISSKRASANSLVAIYAVMVSIFAYFLQ